MAIEVPLWMDPAPGEERGPATSARQDRAIIASLFTEGVADVGAGDLRVSVRASGAAMSVEVAAGAAYVAGDEVERQGTYRVVSTAVETVAIPGAPSTGTRYDLVVLRVRDAAVTGGTQQGAFLEVVQGTAAASPVVPAVPPTALVLARVRVASGQGSVMAGNIADLREQSGANVLRVGTQVNSSAVADLPDEHAEGRLWWLSDQRRAVVDNGRTFTPLGAGFGDGSDGDLTVSGTYIATRSMSFRSLTVPSGATFRSNGYPIRAQQRITVAAGGAIRDDGSAGASVTVENANGGRGGDGARLGQGGLGGEAGAGDTSRTRWMPSGGDGGGGGVVLLIAPEIVNGGEVSAAGGRGGNSFRGDSDYNKTPNTNGARGANTAAPAVNCTMTGAGPNPVQAGTTVPALLLLFGGTAAAAASSGAASYGAAHSGSDGSGGTGGGGGLVLAFAATFSGSGAWTAPRGADGTPTAPVSRPTSEGTVSLNKVC